MIRKLASLILALALLAVPAGGVWAEETKEETETAEEPLFADVDPAAWYAPAIVRLAEEEIVRGYEDGLFRPSGAVTWGEALKLILLSAGFTSRSAPEGIHWADGYLASARSLGYLPKDRAVNLAAPITRYEAADLCAAALELDLEAPGRENPFADTVRRSVLALYAEGLVLGFVRGGELVFGGRGPMTRAELCAVLARMRDYVAVNFTYVSGLRAKIDFELRFHGYDPGAFRLVDGRIRCDDGTLAPRFGIDVSYFQREIDWEAVAADGVDFAMIRCGFRGYGAAGSVNEDVRFRENIEGALAAGLDVGVYFFSQAVTVEEALEEAEFVLELIADYDLSFPVAYDWERITDAGSRSADPDWDTVSDCAVAFCDAVAEAGYTPLTYYNKHMSYLQLDMRKLQKYEGWLAMYQGALDYLYDFQMWQYSSTGHVAGIPTPVDLDICFVDYAARTEH